MLWFYCTPSLFIGVHYSRSYLCSSGSVFSCFSESVGFHASYTQEAFWYLIPIENEGLFEVPLLDRVTQICIWTSVSLSYEPIWYKGGNTKSPSEIAWLYGKNTGTVIVFMASHGSSSSKVTEEQYLMIIEIPPLYLSKSAAGDNELEYGIGGHNILFCSDF